MRTSRAVRIGVAAVAALGLPALSLAPIAAAQEDPDGDVSEEQAPVDDDVRLDPGDIAGFDLDAVATPVTVRIFDPFIPIPADPGDPNVEVTLAHARSQLGAGPVSRGLSSLVWPGPGVGDGFGNFAEELGMDPESTYPLRASAQYPSGPVEEDTQPGMRAVARGLDVEGVTELAGELIPGLLGTGTASSRTHAVVEDGIADAAATSTIVDLQLFGGLVTLDALETSVEATSDGSTATSDGGTAVTGLTIMGTRYVVDDEGVRVEEEDEDGPFSEAPALPLRVLGIVDLSDLIGVTVEAGDVDVLDSEDDVAAAGRTARGLTITLDASLLFDVLNQLPVQTVLELLPDDLQRELAPFLGLGPTIELVIGRAKVEVAGSEPFEFEAPDLELPDTDFEDAPPDLGFDDAPSFDAAPTFDEPADPSAAPPLTDAPADAADATPPPQAAPRATQVASIPEGVGGLAVGLLALAAFAVMTGAFGLDRLSGAVFAPPGAAGGCPHGHRVGVPDLRGGAA